MQHDMVLRDDADGVATITLNRPAARNALSGDLMTALLDRFEAIHRDRTVRVVVLAANGPVFCAGHDLKELRANPGRTAHAALFALCSKLMTRIVRLRQPVIAQVQGMATAAGCQLVASCDLAIAADGARFATPGVNIGLFCSTPMVALSRNVGTKAAMGMLLTGTPIDATQARAIGLINEAVDADALAARCHELALTIAAKSPYTLQIGKEAFYRQLDMPLEEAYAYASEVMTTNMMARDAQEGIDAFLERRPAEWQGC